VVVREGIAAVVADMGLAYQETVVQEADVGSAVGPGSTEKVRHEGVRTEAGHCSHTDEAEAHVLDVH
jgi:hypothetical protein